MIGRVFNERYRITERVGIGGMAEVYKAQDQTLGRMVAVKIMLPQYAADPEFAARFKQEAASAANLQSPYIVNVYDWGQDEGTYYIVMEYVRGTDLKSAINQRGAINQRKVADIGSQVCQALSVAHSQDIVHRDIKPQNIMVQPDGNVKVMDFGIARAKNSVKSKTSSVLGTAHYISPEQAQGKELTGASDIYSLGCVLYEAATGQVPFDGPDAVSVAMRQVNEPPVPPTQINPDISPDLEAIILKAMDKNPYGRFQTARDMKQALDNYLMGRPVNLAGAGFASAPTSVMGAVAPIAAGEAGATSVMNPVDSASTTKPATYRNGNNIEVEKGKNKKPIIIAVAALVALLVIGGIAFALVSGGSKADTVPNVVGATQEAAKQTLEKAGYELGEVTEDYDSKVEAGKVCKQDPTQGTELEKGSKVNIVVSKGVKKGTVPDLSNMTSEQAEKAITEAGFKAQYAGNESSDATKDTVSKQDPAAGKEAEDGTTIKYWISTGPESVDVPNVVGSDQATAKSKLESAGFKVTTENGGYSSDYGNGVVMAQSVSGKADKGSSITLTISQGADPDANKVTVPYLVGESENEAVNDLIYLGLNYKVSYTTTGSGTDGAVVGQSAEAGSKIEKGSTVTVTVYKEQQSSGGGSGSGSGGSSDSGSGSGSTARS